MNQRLKALALVMPLLLFIIITFVAPIADMLFRSVENDIVAETLPRTVSVLKEWDPEADQLPPEAAYQAMVEDLRIASATKTHTRVGQRLNYESPGVSSLFRKTPRRLSPRSASAKEKLAAKIEEEGYKALLVSIDKKWGEPDLWRTIKAYSGVYTAGYFLSGLDLKSAPEGGIEWKEDDQRIYLQLFQRTLLMSCLITVMTLLVGYPVAYLLATLPLKTSNLLMILVLLPFWTSLLVRTSAWIVLLQQQGVINDLLVFSGLNSPMFTVLSLFGSPDVRSLCQDDLTGLMSQGEALLRVTLERGPNAQISTCLREVASVYQANGLAPAMELGNQLREAGEANGYGDERFAMIFNKTGTVVAMTHILLPFMILPLYSVMKTLPPSYVRAAKSLGATNWTAFWRVYFPNTIPGVGAGAILVFILSIGYYITPELVGGTGGTFISNRIAYHISSSLNWGLAAALGSLLLFVVLVLYYVYDRIVGVDNVKLG